MTPFPFGPERLQAAYLLFGVRIYERWNLPLLSHACAIELLALEQPQ